METLLIAMRFLHFVAVMILFGSSLFTVYVSAADRPYRVRLSRFLKKGVWVGVPLALLSALVWLGCEAALMSGDPGGFFNRQTLLTVLGSTEFGHIWRWRLGVLSVLAFYLICHPEQREGSVACRQAGRCYRVFAALRMTTTTDWPILLGGLLLVITLAGVGHGAMGVGAEAWLHLANQAFHMLAAATWVGGLLPLWYTARYVRSAEGGMGTLGHALKRFSLVGFCAVLLLLATGGLNAWFLVGSLHALLYTAYGQVLMLKLAFFFAMIVLALINRFYLMPHLSEAEDYRQQQGLLVRSLVVEQCFAVLALAAVSVLGTMTPAFDMPGMAM